MGNLIGLSFRCGAEPLPASGHRVVDVQVVELGDGDDVAGDRLLHLFLGLALEPVEVAGLGGLAGAEVEQRRVAGDPARVDAEEAELAHEQVVGRLEDLGDQLAVLERARARRRRRSVRIDAVPVRRRPGVRLQSARRFSSSLTPMSFLDRDADDGHELAVGDGAGRGGLELGGGELLAFEVAVHQVVVGLDDLLDDHLVGLGRVHRAIGGDVFVRDERIDDAGEARALADRHVEGHALGAERLADPVEDSQEVDVVGVHLGDAR